jgi:hypothetical protein
VNVKRLTVILAIATIAAMVPAASASSAPVSSQATNASVYIINAFHAVAPGVAEDVWDGNHPSETKIATAIADGQAATVSVTAGAHILGACQSPSTQTVPTNGGGNCTPMFGTGSATVNIVGGTNVTSIGEPAGGFFFTNDISPTAFGKGRFTLNNVAGVGGIDVCLDGNATPILANVANGAAGETEVPAEVNASIRFAAGGSNCTVFPFGPAFHANLAAGTNFVFNLTQSTTCTTACVQIIQVDQARPVNSAATNTFCAVLNPGLQALKAEIKSTLGGVNVNNLATAPGVATIQNLVNDINTQLNTGDATVPASVKPQWEIAVAGLRQLAEGLTSAGYNLALIPTASLQKIVDGANGVNQTANAAVDAATAVLTNFFLTSCVSSVVTPQLKFTG